MLPAQPCAAFVQTEDILGEVAKASGYAEVTVDEAAFMVAMKDVNFDVEFSRRLFEFLDAGAHV